MTMRTTLCAVTAASLLMAACGTEAREDQPVERIVTGAKTVLVVEQPFAEELEATAMVSARPGHLASLGAPGASRISAVRVVAGQRVARGEVLVELDQVTFQGALSTAEAALAAADKQHARQQRLVEQGIAPRREVELAASELAAARATAEAAKRQAELSVIRSPIAGVVTHVAAVLGAMADPAQALVQVADGTVLDLALSLPPDDARRVAIGAAVEIVADGRNAAVLGNAVITAVGSAIDSATRAVPVRAAVHRVARTLQIGEAVPVRIKLAHRTRAIVVPVEALVPDGEAFKVFVVDAHGLARARHVELGGRAGDVAEVTKGLAAGERIVTYGAYGMDDSVRVAPVRGAPSAKPGPADKQ